MSESDHFTPSSIEYVSPKNPTVSEKGKPVRLAFKPFGRRRVGTPDENHSEYQILDAKAHISGPSGTVYITDVAGREFMISDGRRFSPTDSDDIPEELRLDLSDVTPVLGAQTHDDEGGYVAVGTHVVVLIPN